MTDRMTQRHGRPADLALRGSSDAMRRLRAQIAAVAPYLRSALLVADDAAHSEAIARGLHRLGPASALPFTVTSGRALNEAVDEAEIRFLLGVDDGFAGGVTLLRDADRLTAAAQGFIVRVLRSERSEAKSLRLLAAAHRDPAESGVGTLLPELMKLLGAVRLRFPRLSVRVEDLPDLVDVCLRRLEAEGASSARLEEGAMKLLLQHRWPGNYAELERVLRTAAAMATGGWVTEEMLKPLLSVETSTTSHGASGRANLRLQEVIDQHVLEVLRRCEGNKVRAAEALGISRSTLYRMLEALPGGGAVGERDGAV